MTFRKKEPYTIEESIEKCPLKSGVTSMTFKPKDKDEDNDEEKNNEKKEEINDEKEETKKQLPFDIVYNCGKISKDVINIDFGGAYYVDFKNEGITKCEENDVMNYFSPDIIKCYKLQNKYGPIYKLGDVSTKKFKENTNLVDKGKFLVGFEAGNGGNSYVYSAAVITINENIYKIKTPMHEMKFDDSDCVEPKMIGKKISKCSKNAIMLDINGKNKCCSLPANYFTKGGYFKDRRAINNFAPSIVFSKYFYYPKIYRKEVIGNKAELVLLQISKTELVQKNDFQYQFRYLCIEPENDFNAIFESGSSANEAGFGISNIRFKKKDGRGCKELSCIESFECRGVFKKELFGKCVIKTKPGWTFPEDKGEWNNCPDNMVLNGFEAKANNPNEIEFIRCCELPFGYDLRSDEFTNQAGSIEDGYVITGIYVKNGKIKLVKTAGVYGPQPITDKAKGIKIGHQNDDITFDDDVRFDDKYDTRNDKFGLNGFNGLAIIISGAVIIGFLLGIIFVLLFMNKKRKKNDYRKIQMVSSSAVSSEPDSVEVRHIDLK